MRDVRKRPIRAITSEEWRADFNATKAMMQRYYCTTFKFWVACPFKPCRKARRCCGDQNACLKRGIDQVPRHVQFRARQYLIKITPPDAGRGARTARQYMPLAFYEHEELAVARAAVLRTSPKGRGRAKRG
jgi:hypothetical protein